MKKLFNGVALVVGVTCLVWVAVLWQWQRTHRDMSMDDIVVYLVLLPLVAIALVFMARWAWRSVQARHAAQQAARQAAAAASGAGATATASGAGGAAAPAAGAVPQAEAAERQLAWPVWGVALQSPGGASAEELLSAAEALAPRPALDDQLRDAEGAPLMCARIPDVQPDALRDAFEAQGGVPDDAVMRAVAALQPVLSDILPALRTFVPESPEAVDASTLPTLQCLLGVPASWSPDDRERVRAAVVGQLRDELPPAWPRDAVRLAVCAEGGEAHWRAADDLLVQAQRQQRPVLVLALAAHSDLSDAAADRLAQARRLFHPGQCPKGHMPGEAAAAVLLATPSARPPQAPPGHPSPQALAWLHRPACGQRDKSVDAAGKVSSELLETLFEHACQAARSTPDQVAALVCDADQHSARGTELFGATLARLPQLDAAADLRLTGVVCGGAGAATPLVVLAAACAHARAIEHLVLAACVGDPHHRLVALARPLGPEPSAEPAAGTPPAATS